MLLAEAAATTSTYTSFDIYVLIFTVVIAIAVIRQLINPRRNLFALGFAVVSLTRIRLHGLRHDQRLVIQSKQDKSPQDQDRKIKGLRAFLYLIKTYTYTHHISPRGSLMSTCWRFCTALENPSSTDIKPSSCSMLTT